MSAESGFKVAWGQSAGRLHGLHRDCGGDPAAEDQEDADVPRLVDATMLPPSLVSRSLSWAMHLQCCSAHSGSREISTGDQADIHGHLGAWSSW